MAEQQNQPHVPERHFILKHNQIALLDENLRGIDDYKEIIRFLRRSRIAHALTANVRIVKAYMEHFWATARVNNNDTIEATVNGQQIVITEEVIRAALQLGELDHGEICYDATIRERAVRHFGYSGPLPSRQINKGMLREKWRFFFHVIMQCFAPRKSGMDGMGHKLLSAMIGLTFNQPYNFARMILRALQTQISYEAGNAKLMLLYPRFLMLIFKHLIPNIPIHEGLPQLVQTPMTRRIFTHCRNVKPSVHSNALPEIRPMLGAILHAEDYNLAADQTWIEITAGVNQLFGRIVGDDVEMEIEIEQAGPNLNESRDMLLEEIDAAIETEAPTAKGKGKLVEDDVVMLNEKEYLRTVRKDLVAKLSEEDQAKLAAFRNKVESLGPTSEWALKLAVWNDKLTDLDALPVDSSDSDSDHDGRSDVIPVSQSKQIVNYKRRRIGEGSSSSPRLSEAESVSTIDVSAAVVTTVTGGLSVLGVPVSLSLVIAAIPVPSSMELISEVGPRMPTPRLEGPRPTAPQPRPRSAAEPSRSEPMFPEYVQNKFDEVDRFLAEQTKNIKANQDLIKEQQKTIKELQKKGELYEKHLLGMAANIHGHAQQIAILIKRDIASTTRHRELCVANEQIRRIVTELVELFAAQGESGSNKELQVQAQCKLDELKKIYDDLDKDKDPNASQQREQPVTTGKTNGNSVQLNNYLYV
ncbi:hypothetical protein HanLR1_Chr01g0021031 [Helianthus annuus]|nr:hypothetical protein HanLR1_Chr01g0021031 [Helianthus annuus]